MEIEPAYSTGGKFYYLDGRIEEAQGYCKIANILVLKSNYMIVSSKYGLPHSLLLSLMAKKDYISDISQLKTVVFDIETDDKETFLFAIANGEKFDDPQKLCDYLMQFNVIAGFNNFRFDNEILFKLSPKHFQTIDQSGFKMHIFKNKINIDLLFFFQLWQPTISSHSLNSLASELGIEREFDLTNKEGKCNEDIFICMRFMPFAQQIFRFLASSRIDHMSYSTLPAKWISKLRRWMLQSYFIRNNIEPTLIKKETDLKPASFMLHKKGFYKNVFSFDVKSAYPTTAIAIDATLIRQGDFAAYQKELIALRNQMPEIASCIKGIQNATIGDMGSDFSLLHDKELMATIWLTFKSKMEEWSKRIRKKNIIFSYTDSMMTLSENIAPFPDKSYTVALKHKFIWLAVFNQIKTIGMTEDGELKKTQFLRDMPSLKMYHYIDKSLYSKLNTAQKARKFLANPTLPIALEDLPTDAFKITIRKTDSVCRIPDYIMIWDKLQIGFNDIFLCSKDDITTDASKLNMKRYQRLADKYIAQFKINKRYVA